MLRKPVRLRLQLLHAADFQRGATASLTQMGKLRHPSNHRPGLEAGFLLSPMAGTPQGPNCIPFLLGLQPPPLDLALAWQAGGQSCCCHCWGARRQGEKRGVCCGTDAGVHSPPGSFRLLQPTPTPPWAHRPLLQLDLLYPCSPPKPTTGGGPGQAPPTMPRVAEGKGQSRRS